MHLRYQNILQNEEERDENEDREREPNRVTTTMSNSKFGVNEIIEHDKMKANDQNNRPNDLPSLSSNHIITSPTNSNSNAVWNTDTWADGEFEPLEEVSGEAQLILQNTFAQ